MPVAVICGLPGIGKTTLALRTAHQLRSRFPDGQLWIQLDGASARPRDPGDILGELLRALGIPGAAIPDRTAEKAAMYRSRLADRKILLVADDADTVAQVRHLVLGTAGSAVIVTSRHQLTELPGASILPIRGGAGRLVAACGHLPLAVRIAGARLAGRPSWPVSVISEALADQHRACRPSPTFPRQTRPQRQARSMSP